MNRVPLADLCAAWRQIEGRTSADCLYFRCPACSTKKSHAILVATRQPPVHPGGAVWKVDGSRDIDTLTLRPSINCNIKVTWPDGSVTEPACTFHGHVRNGHVEW